MKQKIQKLSKELKIKADELKKYSIALKIVVLLIYSLFAGNLS